MAPWARVAGGVALVALLVATLAYGWGRDTGSSPDSPAEAGPSALSPAPTVTEEGVPSEVAPTNPSTPDASPRRQLPAKVLAISVDGLSAAAIKEEGPAKLPTLHRLLEEGAATLNARSAAERSVTLPNHVGMVTGRRIDAAHGGHGVTWNSDRAHDTVQRAAGSEVASIFTVAHARGVHTALFAGKSKFDIFEDSWGAAIDEVVIDGDETTLVAAAKADLAQRGPRLLFLHLDPPDAAGHASGGMGPAYLAAVRKVDGLVGDILAMIDEDPDLAASVRVVLTADHGFVAGGRLHDAVDSQNYTVPFVVWGAGVTPGDLYGRNPGLEDPGTARPGYDGPQPIRNLDVADAVLGSLGLPLLSRPGDPPPLRW